jgi:hypothetical protein
MNAGFLGAADNSAFPDFACRQAPDRLRPPVEAVVTGDAGNRHADFSNTPNLR